MARDHEEIRRAVVEWRGRVGVFTSVGLLTFRPSSITACSLRGACVGSSRVEGFFVVLPVFLGLFPSMFGGAAQMCCGDLVLVWLGFLALACLLLS